MNVTLCIKGFREISTCWFHQWLIAAISVWFPGLILLSVVSALVVLNFENIFCWMEDVKEALKTLTDFVSFAKVSSCEYIECLAYEAVI